MLRDALRGAAAGAVGTFALDVTTYLDMAVRGRPSSEAPVEIAGKVAQTAGIDLAARSQGPDDQKARTAAHRKTGIGALMGYATGLGVGALYGVLRPRVNVPAALLGVGAGMTAMAASDVPAITIAQSDPKTWGASGWLADIVPHLVYGLFTALTFEALREH